MGKKPNYKTGIKGRNWSQSLRMAQDAGAVIIVAETGMMVTWNKPTQGSYFRPWIDKAGNRYDSYECEPVLFPQHS